MFEIHVVWFLLPFGLFCLTLWAFIKKMTGVPGREYGTEYLLQFIFCTILFVISVWFDNNYYEALAAMTGWRAFDPGFARFLIFPAILLFAAKFQAIITREDEKKKPNQMRSKVGN